MRFVSATRLALALAWMPACGSDAPAGSSPGIVLPPIVTPLQCSKELGTCTCNAADSGLLDASAAVCSTAVAPDASCCAEPDYPYVGACTCGAGSCSDGGARLTSCSSPTTYLDAAVCDESTCSGSACAGGYCCTSACESGECVQTCSGG